MALRWSAPGSAALVVLALGACGREPAARDASPPVPQQPARLVVRVEREYDPSRPVLVEGALGFLRVERTAGRAVVADGRIRGTRGPSGEETVLDERVEPGEYRLVGYQRACNGNCEQLSPPGERCELVVGAPPGETVTATFVLGQAGGCRLRERG